jgi:HK97 family phage major capsid protein
VSTSTPSDQDDATETPIQAVRDAIEELQEFVAGERQEGDRADVETAQRLITGLQALMRAEASDPESSRDAPVSEQRTRPVNGQVEERTAAALEVQGRRIRGIVPYGIESRDMGGWREVIEPTAFSTTNFDELRAVIDHRGVPLATWPRTLHVENRADGLHWSFDPPKSRQDVVEAIERGDMRSGSWRMRVSQDRWAGDVRHVEAISHLHDVTITGAELPAYPAAAIEYRSTNPAEGQEVTTMAEQADTNQQETESRGLNVEDRVEVVPSRRGLFEELAVAAREVNVGEVRSLTTSISLAPPEMSVQFFDVLRPASAFLRSGVRTLTTDRSTVIYPELTSDPTVGWWAEGGTITASDPAFGAGTVTPHKMATRVEYSNELAEDSAPALEPILREALVARAGVVLDQAAYEGSGSTPIPRGMGNLAGIQSVNVSAAATSVAWAGSAIALLEAANAPRPYAIAGAAQLWKNTRLAKLGTSYDAPVVNPTSSGDVPALYGAQGYTANALTGGTAYIYSPSSCYVVNRYQEFMVEINRLRLFDSDRSEMRLKARLDVFFPYVAAAVKGTAVPS